MKGESWRPQGERTSTPDDAVNGTQLQRRADARNDSWQIPHHLLRRNAQHPVASSGQPPIATRIRSLARCVVGAIDLDDQARFGSREVDDALADDDPPPAP